MSSKKQTNVGPRDYKISDIKRLFALSGNQCSKPECTRALIAEDGLTVIAKICHIEAAKKGGARYREDMDDDERRSYENLILLCDEHHQTIDNKANKDEFTTPILKDWKEKHTSKNTTTSYSPSEHIIEHFIEITKLHYAKLDSIDGPYAPVISYEYVSREIEATFLPILEEKSCLLLTGISFCGKSEMARNLANYYYQKGYIYKRVSNVRDAGSFLESVGTNRVCFLEDPFGHMLGDEKPNELKRLQDLLQNIQENHKLIITSRKEIVQSIFGTSSLMECQIESNSWYDITVSDISFLNKIWSNIVAKRELKEENVVNVRTLLSSNKLLQPGQLVYLAKLPDLKSKVYDTNRLYQIAQIDAREFRQAIINIDDYTWKIFLLLGLGCDTINGCTYEDLRYVLDSNKKECSLEPKREGLSSFLGKEPTDFVFPDYPDTTNDIDGYERGINLLEERGYVRLEHNEYVFTHPQYREIARGFIINMNAIKQRKILPFIHNLLTCLNSEVAYNTAKNLELIFKNFNVTFSTELTKTVFDISESSYFPKVLDQCYLYLLQNFRANNVEEYQQGLLFKLQSSTDNSNIVFIEGKPIKYRDVSSLSQLFISSELPYSRILENINNAEPVSSENIWSTLLSVNRLEEELSIEFLEYAFKNNEVFIRNLAAYNYFLNVNKFHDSILKDKILIDEQPSVLFYALKGFLQGIPNNGKYLNKELMERFLYFFNNDEIFCIRSSNLMTNFSTDYASDSIDWKVINHNRKFWVWRIWADLFIAFMKTFPKNARFSHTPRFSGMMTRAKEFVYPEQAVKISKGLLGYIEANLKTRVPDNFEMHLMDFLIDATQEKPHLRLTVFKKLISNPYTTTFNGYSLSWAVSRWELLELKERQIIMDLITSSRVDVDWLKAILINSCLEAPPELQEIIFGQSDLLSQPIENIIANIPKPFLEKLIIVYSGRDGALDEIGLSHRNILLKSITLHIAKNSIEIEYENCVLLFLTDILNGIREEEWENVKSDWLQTVQSSSNIDKLVELVINQVSRTSFIVKETKYVFKSIIDKYTESGRIDYLANLIANNIENLTYTSGDRDVFYVLGSNKFLSKLVFPLIPRNNLLLNLLIGLEKDKVTNDDFRKYLKPIIDEKNEPIHFRLIFDKLKKLYSEKLLEEDIFEQLNTIPNNITERQKEYFETEERTEKLKDFIYFLN